MNEKSRDHFQYVHLYVFSICTCRQPLIDGWHHVDGSLNFPMRRVPKHLWMIERTFGYLTSDQALLCLRIEAAFLFLLLAIFSEAMASSSSVIFSELMFFLSHAAIFLSLSTRIAFNLSSYTIFCALGMAFHFSAASLIVSVALPTFPLLSSDTKRANAAVGTLLGLFISSSSFRIFVFSFLMLASLFVSNSEA